MKGPDLAGWGRSNEPRLAGQAPNGSGSASAATALAVPEPVATRVTLGQDPVACGRAGPGDPGLMTVRSRELLGMADVVVLDDLGEDFVRNFTCADVRVVRVSRHTGSTSGDGATASADGLTDESTDDLGEQLVAEARRLGAGSLVVRLMYGDPMAFHGLAAEALSLRELSERIAAAAGYTGTTEWDTTKPDGTPRRLMDVSRLTSMGWSPSIDLNAGIAEVVAWFREHRDDFRH